MYFYVKYKSKKIAIFCQLHSITLGLGEGVKQNLTHHFFILDFFYQYVFF